MSIASKSLFFRQGGSDKVYHVQIESQEDSFVVNFQYGRRGSALQTGSKTPTPVSLAKAQSTFGKLIQEKMAKGYTEGEEGTPFAGTDNAGMVSGLVPQLLNPIEEHEVQNYLDSPLWMMQEKKDGVRCMVRVDDNGQVIASNRKGLIVSLPTQTQNALRTLASREDGVVRPFVVDGEQIDQVYWAFDLLELNGEDLREEQAIDRFELLAHELEEDYDCLALVDACDTRQCKAEMYSRLRAQRAEGVVFKRVDSPYEPGRPNSGGDQRKFKFTASATLGVIAINDGKRSVQLGAWTIRGWENVGNVTIPANHEIPRPLDMVEVQYLYAYPVDLCFRLSTRASGRTRANRTRTPL